MLFPLSSTDMLDWIEPALLVTSSAPKPVFEHPEMAQFWCWKPPWPLLRLIWWWLDVEILKFLRDIISHRTCRKPVFNQYGVVKFHGSIYDIASDNKPEGWEIWIGSRHPSYKKTEGCPIRPQVELSNCSRRTVPVFDLKLNPLRKKNEASVPTNLKETHENVRLPNSNFLNQWYP